MKMDTGGFRKLRIAVAAGVAGSSVVAGAPRGLAATQALPEEYAAYNGVSGSSWVVDGNWLYPGNYPFGTGYGLYSAGIRGTDFSSQCFSNGLGGVSCFPNHNPTTLAPGLGSAFLLKVGTTVYKAPNGVIDVNGNTFTSSSKLSGFKVEYRIVFLGNRRAAVLYSFKNPKTVTKKARVEIASALNASNITLTESGGTELGVDDAWFVDTPSNTNSAPVVTIARGDCDGCANSQIVRAPTDGNSTWVERYTFRVRPKKTKRLLFFVELSEDFDPDPQVFDNASSLNTAGLLGTFTARQRSQVINWRDLG